MMDIIDRLRLDEVRCETQFSKGVARNIREAADEIERLRTALQWIAKSEPIIAGDSFTMRRVAREALAFGEETA